MPIQPTLALVSSSIAHRVVPEARHEIKQAKFVQKVARPIAFSQDNIAGALPSEVRRTLWLDCSKDLVFVAKYFGPLSKKHGKQAVKDICNRVFDHYIHPGHDSTEQIQGSNKVGDGDVHRSTDSPVVIETLPDDAAIVEAKRRVAATIATRKTKKEKVVQIAEQWSFVTLQSAEEWYNLLFTRRGMEEAHHYADTCGSTAG